MASKVVTLPNLLTVVRMALIPVFVGALYYQRFGWALAVFMVAGVTDGLDGLFARRFNQYSQLGQILDPIADKLLLVTSFITLSMPSIMAPEALVQPHPRHLPVPFWVTAAVISRDVFIIVGAATINVVTGFRGFRPSWLGKVNTTSRSEPSCSSSSPPAFRPCADTCRPSTRPSSPSPSSPAPTTSSGPQNC